MICDVDNEAEEEASNLLLDKDADSSGQVKLAFCPLTTTKLAPALPLFLAGWSDCINDSMPFLLSSSVSKIMSKC